MARGDARPTGGIRRAATNPAACSGRNPGAWRMEKNALAGRNAGLPTGKSRRLESRRYGAARLSACPHRPDGMWFGAQGTDAPCQDSR